jgi:hypothetical protein
MLAGCYRCAVPTWLLVLIAILMGAAIWFIGIGSIRAFSPKPGEEKHDLEDVEGLDVFFVCGECGTELKVTMLGELQVPRHCGERMKVVRRPAGSA